MFSRNTDHPFRVGGKADSHWLPSLLGLLTLLTAVAAVVAVVALANVVADQGASSCAANRAHRAAKDGIADHTTSHSAYAGADLSSVGAVCAASHSHCANDDGD